MGLVKEMVYQRDNHTWHKRAASLLAREVINGCGNIRADVFLISLCPHLSTGVIRNICQRPCLAWWMMCQGRVWWLCWVLWELCQALLEGMCGLQDLPVLLSGALPPSEVLCSMVLLLCRIYIDIYLYIYIYMCFTALLL